MGLSWILAGTRGRGLKGRERAVTLLPEKTSIGDTGFSYEF